MSDRHTIHRLVRQFKTIASHTVFLYFFKEDQFLEELVVNSRSAADCGFHIPHMNHIHPSIHYLNPFSPNSGHRELLESIPALFGPKAEVHPGQVASPLQGHM